MKKTHLLYSIAALAVFGILASVMGYATKTYLTPVPEEQAPEETTITTPAEMTTPAVKKKTCSCCNERIARLREQHRKLRARRQSVQQAEDVASSRKPTP